MRPLLVLRPEPGATATRDRAAAIGLEAIAAPLFAIRPIQPDLARLAGTPEALLVTSGSAVRSIAAHPGAGTILGLPVYAVGEATAAAARAAGFGPVVAGAGDAAAILAQAASDGITRLLHLAGREHRAVEHPGVTIDRVIVYASEPADALPAPARLALDRGAVALLHSPRAAALFARLLAEAGRPRGRVAALSPAVAEAAGAGWAALAVADRPTDAALLAVAARLCEGAC